MTPPEKTKTSVRGWAAPSADDDGMQLFGQLATAAYVLQDDRIAIYNRATIEVLGHPPERLDSANYWEIGEGWAQEEIRDRGRAWLRGHPMEAHSVCPIVTERGERKWIEVFRRRMEFRGAPALLISALDLTERWAWLESAKRLMARHGKLLSGDARQELAGYPAHGDEDHGPEIRALTRRQRQVLDLIARGRSNKQIALQLGITEGTVKLHVFTLMRGFKVPNRTLLALIAHKVR